jgi:hypothetical protein
MKPKRLIAVILGLALILLGLYLISNNSPPASLVLCVIGASLVYLGLQAGAHSRHCFRARLCDCRLLSYHIGYLSFTVLTANAGTYLWPSIVLGCFSPYLEAFVPFITAYAGVSPLTNQISSSHGRKCFCLLTFALMHLRFCRPRFGNYFYFTSPLIGLHNPVRFLIAASSSNSKVWC